MNCARCGGRCLLLDGEMACINCGRPCHPVVPLALVVDPRDIATTIRRERLYIDRQIAAGKRAWS